MIKLFQVPVFAIALVLLGSWSFSEIKEKAVLMIVDENEKISMLESGKINRNVFEEGIKALSVMHKEEEFSVTGYMLTYAPKEGDAGMLMVAQEKNISGDYVRKKLSSLTWKEGDRIIIDRVDAVDREGNEIRLAPIVLYIK